MSNEQNNAMQSDNYQATEFFRLAVEAEKNLQGNNPLIEDEAIVWAMSTITSEINHSNNVSDDLNAALALVADIRKAAGDEAGKLMQDELVEHIRELHRNADNADNVKVGLQSMTGTTIRLLKLVRDMHGAAGDPEERLTWAELVEHIKRLKDENRKLNDYIANAGLDPLTNHMEQNK